MLFCGGHAWAQAYNWKPVVFGGGGYVTGIVIHPNVSGVMYCRTDIGTAYRWNPTNDTWTPLLDFLGVNDSSYSGVESIALDPEDSNRLYLSCGWLSQTQIMVSTNQGATFTRITPPFNAGANDNGRGCGERMAVDPNLGNIILYGSRTQGLYESINYGTNWSQVTGFPATSSTNGCGIMFLQFVSTSSSPGNATPVIWAGVSQTGTNLFRSTDGGTTWTGVATAVPSSIYMPMRAALDGLGNMYVTFCDEPGPNGVNVGDVQKINLSTLACTDVTPPTGQGGFSGVTVDAENPNTVAISTIDRWYPHDEIYRSTDGGTTWSTTYANSTMNYSSAPWVGGTGGSSTVYPSWITDVEIDPFNSNRLYHVSGGGLFSSYNFTAPQPSWEFQSAGIEENAFSYTGAFLCSLPTSAPPILLSVVGDEGGYVHYDLDVSPPAGLFNPADGTNSSIDFAQLNPSIVVRTGWGAPYGFYSTNSGSTWTGFKTYPAAATTSSNGPGMIAVAADGSAIVWALPGETPYYSTNNGATWSQCGGNATPTTSWEVPSVCSDRVNPSKFYVYIPDSGVVYTSTDGGANFSEGPTIDSWADCIYATYGQEGNVWVVDSDAGLWRSTNSGASFSQVSGVQAANSVGFGCPNGGAGYPDIYLTGEIGNTWGIYRSENQGGTWTRINDDQHQYVLPSQAIGDPNIYGRCYIAAGGRGILYGDVPVQAPSTPANVVATACESAVDLSWDTPVGAASYTIHRGTTSGGPYTTIASGVTATSYQDSGLADGTTYYYIVTASNTYGPSADSAEVSVTPSGLTAHYTLNGNVLDSSGNGYNGTAYQLSYVTGTATSLAAQFHSSWYSCVVIPATVTNDFTVTMWVMTTDTAASSSSGQWWSGEGLVDGAVWGSGNMWGTSLLNGNFVLGVGTTAGGQITISSTTSINDGNWHHVAATRKSTTGAVQIYVDGVLNVAGTAPTGSLTSPSTFAIGRLNTGNNFFNGTIDDVRLYSRALGAVEIAAFVTPPPAAPTALAVTTGSSSVTLSWTGTSTATSYYVERSTTSGTGYTTIATTTSPSFTDAGVTDGTPYYYVVCAVNASGVSPNSSGVSTTPQGMPAVPTGLIATGSNAVVSLSWTAAAGATSYNVLRSVTSGTGYTSLASGVSRTTYSDTAVTNGTTYYYVVSAWNTSGTSANSAQASATPVAPPSAPAGLTAAGSNAEVTLNWTAATGATSYNVLRSVTSGTGYTSLASGVTGSTYSDTTVTNGTTYYYLVSASNPGGTSAYSAQASATPRNAGSGVYLRFDETSGTTAADSTGGGWNGTLVNGPSLVAGRINNAVGLNGTNQYVSLPTSVVASLTNFTVAAWVKVNKRANWERVFDFGTGTGVYMYLTPVNGYSGHVTFGITTNSNYSEQQLNTSGTIPTGTWTHIAVTLSGSMGTLYVNGTSAATNSAMTLNPASLGATTNNYIGHSQWSSDPYLNGVVDEFHIYNYALTAAQIAQLASPPSAPTGVAVALGNAQATLTWNPAAGATGYNAKRSNTSGSGYATVASVTGTSDTDTGLTDGTPYYYVVTTVEGVAESANSSQVSTTPMAPPAGLTATGSNAVDLLNWNASSGATSYNVLRSVTSGTGYTTIISVTGTTYSDTTVTNGTTYYYVVSASNASGTSAYSPQASATPVAPPSVPTGLVATGSNAVVSLSWNASSGAASYNVQRSVTSGTGYTTIISVTGTTYSDTTVTNGTTYYYVVSASNPGGTSAKSAQASATPSPAIGGDEALPPFMEMTGSGASTNLAFTVLSSVLGHTYQLQYTSNLVSVSWTNIGSPQAGAGSNLILEVTINPATAPAGFYRILIQRM